jgi:hypothetical protein
MEQWVEENGVNRDRCIVRKQRNGIGRALWVRLWAALPSFWHLKTGCAAVSMVAHARADRPHSY